MIEIVLFGILAVLAVFWILRKDERKGRRIPGPKGLPLLGCSLELNEENFHIKFSDYAREYGDIFQFKLMNNTIIGLNSAHLIRLAAAEDGYKQYLNDKPATFYGEMILYGSQSTEFCKNGYSAEHTGYRKGFTKAMKVYGTGGNSNFEELFMTEIKNGMMKRIESYNGGDFEIVSELQRSLSNTLSCVLKGEPFSENDPNGNIFEEFADSADYFVNPSVDSVLTLFPFLRYMPGPYGKQFTRAMKTRETIVNIFFEEQKKSHVPGVIRGVVDLFLEEQMKDREAGQEPFFTDERIICQILEIIAAGLLSTWSVMSSSFICLLNHPEYQDKMFEELDRVAGRERDFDINDKAKCPFLEAVELEILRYIPVVPLLDPKLCHIDLEFDGYDLPKGSIIFGNIWYIHHNEKIWGDPWNFRPERWLGEQGNLVPRDHFYRKKGSPEVNMITPNVRRSPLEFAKYAPLRLRQQYVEHYMSPSKLPLSNHSEISKLCDFLYFSWLPFGYGRRQCIGEPFARCRIFLYMASLLRRWKFVASPGKLVSCDPRDQSSFDIKITMRPKPFYCHVQERY